MPEMPGPDDALRAALHGVRGLLLDLDGVLVLAGKAIPGAPAAMDELDRLAIPYLLVTNTSLVSRVSLAAWGRSVGFSTPPDRLQSALSASAALVRREYGERPVYVIASDDAMAEFRGLNVVDAAGADAAPGEVAAVVLGDSPDQLTKANLDRAFRLVRGGAELIGMHRNPWWITPEGPTLDAGAFLVALEWATRRKARIVGKPSPRSSGWRSSGLRPRRRPGASHAFDAATWRWSATTLARTSAARGAPVCGRCSSGPASTATPSWPQRPPARVATRPTSVAPSLVEVVAALR